MRKIVIVFILFLPLVSIAAVQQEEIVSEENELEVHESIRVQNLPALDNPNCVGWLVSSFREIDWSNPESLKAELALYWACNGTPYIEKPYFRNYYILSFSDSLTIHTYDPETMELYRPISYKMERNGSSFLIYASDSLVVESTPYSIYGDHYVTSNRLRVPVNVAENNVWFAEGADNTENCSWFSNNVNLVAYSSKVRDSVVKENLYTQFQTFTFGEKLVVKTHDVIKDEVIKTEEFEYTTKANDPFTVLVHFSNFSAEFSLFIAPDSILNKFLVVKCVD